MPNPNGTRGKRFEKDLEDALREAGLDAHRPRQTRNVDVGDLHVGDDLVVQAKDWGNVATALTAGVAGAEVQAVHARRPYAVAAIKRRGKHAREAYIAMSLPMFLKLWARYSEGHD